MGWIAIDRKIKDHWLWDADRYDKAHAWLDLLLLANYTDKKMLYKGEVITCKRGDVNLSMSELAKRWRWSRKAVKHFLRVLENDKMVTTRVSTTRTVITLVNYEKYQLENVEGSNQGINEGNNKGSNEGNTTKQINKENKETNKYISSFVDFWKAYPRKQDKGQAYKCYLARLNDGYTPDQLLNACKNYAAECVKNKTDQRYIKHGATFLSVNEPFLDYLREDEGTNYDEIDRYIESDEFRNPTDDLPFM